VLAFTVRVAEPEAAVAPVRVDSSSALVAVAETVVPEATPETEMLNAFEDDTLSAGTGNAIAVAEVVPPVADTVATVSVWVLADAATPVRPRVNAATRPIASLLSFIGFLLSLNLD
jgi:hypothetical protein